MDVKGLTDVELFNVIHGAIRELWRTDLTEDERTALERPCADSVHEASAG
ncbi:hypothetical protein AB6802_13180 [Mesorhizobium sp. RCC_202]